MVFLPLSSFLRVSDLELVLDGSASGARFNVQASPLLAHVAYQAALDIPHPTDEGRTLWDATEDAGPFVGNGSYVPEEYLSSIQNAKSHSDELAKIAPLGSGSDYTVFLQRIGVRLFPCWNSK